MHQSGKTIPKIWLMTDERNDAVLESAVRKLPRYSGIIFRHYHLGDEERARRFTQIRKLAHRKHHLLLLAGHPSLARRWEADGVHGRQWKRRDTTDLLHSAPVHDASEIIIAKRNGADLFFLSPLFATRSHTDAQSLAMIQAKRLAVLCNGPVILMGGMNRRRFESTRHLNTHGWAAIDALS